ncbi:hypothetical protein P3T76_005890 [Phytophthora citrophthora]|uniref:Uncharacterized protein n=1 Tax=Phytophthora citrophthora TaxID=4793 RepID=A0AAD9GQP3_9STRA|nr:hypothetical protein P3T76_005890 [Phytophthora citrophthora]
MTERSPPSRLASTVCQDSNAAVSLPPPVRNDCSHVRDTDEHDWSVLDAIETEMEEEMKRTLTCQDYNGSVDESAQWVTSSDFLAISQTKILQ